MQFLSYARVNTTGVACSIFSLEEDILLVEKVEMFRLLSQLFSLECGIKLLKGPSLLSGNRQPLSESEIPLIYLNSLP